MRPSKAKAKKVERTPTANDIVLFRSPATWTRKAWNEHILTVTRPKEKSPSYQLSEVGSWVVAQIYKAIPYFSDHKGQLKSFNFLKNRKRAL